MVRLVIKCLSVGCIFSIKTVKSLLTLISSTCQWINFSYNYIAIPKLLPFHRQKFDSKMSF